MYNYSNLLAVCSRLQEDTGYAAIFGPDYPDLTDIVRSITITKKIPHIDTRWDTTSAKESNIYINLFPESLKLEMVIPRSKGGEDWTIAPESHKSRGSKFLHQKNAEIFP